MRPFAAAVAAVVALAGSSRLDSAQLQIVRGRVLVGSDAASPLRAARVMLSGAAATAAPVFTDGDGRFALGVPASYSLHVSKSGYAPTLVQGQTAGSSELLVRLSRGAAIAGRVADELGFPVVDAVVRARWLNPPVALRGLATTFVAESDDRGEFRIGSLVPGRYEVQTEQRSRTMDLLNSLTVVPPEILAERARAMREAQSIEPLSASTVVDAVAGSDVFAMIAHQQRAVIHPDAPIGGMVSGAVLDAFGDPLDGVTLRLWKLRYADGRQVAEPTNLVRRTDDRGQYRLFHAPAGRYLLVATADDTYHAPVFYPGVPTVSSASPVVVRRSQELPGVYLTFVRARLSRVSGVVRRPAGSVFGAMNVRLVSLGAVTMAPVPVLADVNGFFEFVNVVPGEYMVQAFRNGVQEVALQRLVVNEGENPSITVTILPTATITGRVVTDDGRALPPGMRLTAMLQPEYTTNRTAFATIPTDGRFELPGLLGPVRFALTNGARGYRLKSVQLGTFDRADEPVVFESVKDSRSDVIVTLATDTATLAGRVTDETGKDADDYRVVLFSVDRRQWYPASPNVQMTAGPNLDGRYTLLDVSPGEYWAIAVDAVEGDAVSGEWQTPEFLDRIAPLARRVTAGERQQLRLDLRLVRRP